MKVRFVPMLIGFVIFQVVFLRTAVASGEEVLVTNKWAEVTVKDFSLELGRLPQQYRGGIEVSGKRVIELIDKILIRKSLAAQARELNMDSEELIQQKINWLTDKLLSQALIERIEKNAIQEFEGQIVAFEKRAEEIYTGNPESIEFKTPFKIGASHILVDIEGRTTEEARSRINIVRDKALAGDSFEELALEFSDDPGVSQNKGNLGIFLPGQMEKSFEEAALGLRSPGEISSIVQTSYGMHIIQLNSKSGGISMSFDQAKPLIVKRLKSDYVQRVRIKHMQEIDSDESMIINEKAIDSLVIQESI